MDIEAAEVDVIVGVGVTDHTQDTVCPSMTAVTHCVCASETADHKSIESPVGIFMVEADESVEVGICDRRTSPP